MSTKIGAGQILPIVSVPSTTPIGNVAIPVYLYTSGNPGGGSATPVHFISSSELKINGGNYVVEGRPVAIPVIAVTGRPVIGGKPIAVYDVTSLNWPSSLDPNPNVPVSNTRVTDTGDTRVTSAGDTRVMS